MAAPLDLIGVQPYFSPLETSYQWSFSTKSAKVDLSGRKSKTNLYC